MATSALRSDSDSSTFRFDDFFFPGMAVVILATVFVGFARSYYLAGLFHAPLPNLLVHVHGAAFTSWIVLLITQTSLVAGGRADLHRRLGLLGFAVACLMVILGVMVATDSMARHVAPGEIGVSQKAFYAVPIADMGTFATLIYLGFRERFHPAAHKRLMLIATIMITDAAFVRWPIPVRWWNVQAAQICCYALLLLLAGYDLWSAKKIHPATLWGSVFVIVIQQIRAPIGRTALWQSLATWVLNLVRSFH